MTIDTRTHPRVPTEVSPEGTIFALHHALAAPPQVDASSTLNTFISNFPISYSGTATQPTRNNSGPFDDRFRTLVQLVEGALEDLWDRGGGTMVVESDPQRVSDVWVSRISRFSARERHSDFEMPDYREQ